MAESDSSRGIMMKNLEKIRKADPKGYGALKEDDAEMQHENPLNTPRQELLNNARNRIIFALTLCSLVLIAEIVGGILSGSLAVLADAGHLFTDVVTYVISLVSIWLARKPTSKRFTYGWLRAEVLGALFSVLLSVALAIILTYFAIMRIVNREFQLDGEIMLIISVINFVGNIVQICQLQFGFCCFERTETGQKGSQFHAHSHGHSHGDSDDVNSHMNVRAACLHILGDSLFGFGLLVGALIIYFKPTLKLVDPILSIIFGVVVLLTLLTLMRDSVNILMEGKPRGVDYDDVRRRLVEIDGVEGVHSLRIWSLTSDVQLVSVHLVLAQLYDGMPVDSPNVLRDARHILETHFRVIHSTIQIETADSDVDFICARNNAPS